MLDRRRFLGAAGALATTALLPRIAYAGPAATEQRFVFIIQRGAADGASAPAASGSVLAGRHGLASVTDQQPSVTRVGM